MSVKQHVDIANDPLSTVQCTMYIGIKMLSNYWHHIEAEKNTREEKNVKPDSKFGHSLVPIWFHQNRANKQQEKYY